jgi:diaminohydroxyphosphoribosylaminopyrimidine deaminase/5-amino-6-(5-phosphoribosylamino)uracil reductase
LHLEGGPRLNAAWLGQGLVDELLVYLAPCLVGPGLPLAGLPALSRLSDSPRFSPVDAQALGNDLRWRLRPQVSNELTDSSTEPGDGV